MPGNYVWNRTEEQRAATNRAPSDYLDTRFWETAFDRRFVENGIGVLDFRRPPSDGWPRYVEIQVYAIEPEPGVSPVPAEAGGSGRLFRVGPFRPGHAERAGEILREGGYESMDRIRIMAKDAPSLPSVPGK